MDLQMIQGAFPLLSIMVVVPVVTALLLWWIPSWRETGRTLAFVISLIELALAIYLAATFDWSNAFSGQWAESYQWISSFGVSWSLAVNALGLVMILLAAFLVPLALLSMPKGNDKREGGYAALIMALYAFIIVIFSAFDVVLFYLAFEGMLIPLFFMIGRYGSGPDRRKAAMKLLIYSLVGGLTMLGGLAAIFGMAPNNADGLLFRFDHLAQTLPTAPYGLQVTVFVTFFIAFAIKAPMVPVHTWLADAAQAARPSTSVLLVGILDKIGTYGMIVFCLVFTPAVAWNGRWVIAILAVVSILWGGFVANGQKNILRLVSFTSVSHFGFMVLGIFIGSQIALTGAMFYMVAHGLSIAALFFISGFLIERGGSQEVDAYGGMQRVTPILAGTWLVAGMASIALPGLSGFVPEYLVLMGTFKVNAGLAVSALFGVVLAAMYILLPYQKIFTGPKKSRLAGLEDLNGREKTIVTPLIIAMLVLGIWAAPLVGAMNKVAEATVVDSSNDVVVVTSQNLVVGEGN